VFRYVTVRILAAVWFGLSVAAAHAAALVGETRAVQQEATLARTPDLVKADFHRPDMIPFPQENPYTPEKAFLGRMLFYDTRLSGSGTLACASCHNPGFSYGDDQAKGIGQGMNPLERRSPSIINSAWGELFMWDGRAASLEAQVFGPIESPVEMNLGRDRLVSVLSGIGEYRSRFAVAFPNQAITPDLIADSIATYERTVISAVAPFDTWIAGEEKAVPDAAKRGFTLFNTKARCASCHGGWLFTDDGFHDIGLPDNDEGRGRLFPHVTAMQHAFKTPSLRETGRRAPYMHDGELPTLAAVVAHYNRGGANRPSQSKLISPLGLSPAEQADIVSFLRTLTSDLSPGIVPALPR
jgi:cytochrome c peroxidase